MGNRLGDMHKIYGFRDVLKSDCKALLSHTICLNEQ